MLRTGGSGYQVVICPQWLGGIALSRLLPHTADLLDLLVWTITQPLWALSRQFNQEKEQLSSGHGESREILQLPKPAHTTVGVSDDRFSRQRTECKKGFLENSPWRNEVWSNFDMGSSDRYS